MTTFVPGFPIFPALSDAIKKTRRLAAANNAFQDTDAYIVQQMQSFYNYDLPAKFRSLKLKDIYTFTTNVGQDVYPFNSELYTTVDTPCSCAKRELKFFTSPWEFYGVNYNWQQYNTFATGNGTNGPYSGYTLATPLIASVNNDPGARTTPNLYFPQGRVQNLLIHANVRFGDTQNVTDDGNGNLIQIFQTAGPQVQYGWQYYRQFAAAAPAIPTARINYATGQITGLYFAEAIPAGTPIVIAYNPVVQAIPLSIMFYQNQFTLRPVPDRGYTIELTAYRQPIQALLANSMTGNPELSEWWEILSVGAAKKMFENRLDSDGVIFIDKMLRERYDIIETRTYAQIGQQRIHTLYTDQLTYNYGSNGFIGGAGAI